MNKKLEIGKGIVGLDYPGCINSGAAPVIMKSRIAKKYLNKPYIVSGQFCISICLVDSLLNAMNGKRTDNMKRFNFKVYKTPQTAWNDFNKRNELIKQEYNHVKQLQAKANKGDMESVLALSDY